MAYSVEEGIIESSWSGLEDGDACNYGGWESGKVRVKERSMPTKKWAWHRLLNGARAAYRRREIEYPVDYIMNVSVRRAQADSEAWFGCKGRFRVNVRLGPRP